MPTQKSLLKREIEENERTKVTDNFQSEIWQTESTLIFLMQHVCPFTQSNQPTDTNFVNQVVATAHLTGEEQKQLFSK